MSKTPRFQLIGSQLDTTKWRLLGGNNVSLGSGAITYASTRECVAAIRWLRANLATTRVDFSHSSGGRWRWLMYADAELIAMASHPYGRRIEAKRGLERFLSAATEAIILTDKEKVADWRMKYRIDVGQPRPTPLL